MFQIDNSRTRSLQSETSDDLSQHIPARHGENMTHLPTLQTLLFVAEFALKHLKISDCRF